MSWNLVWVNDGLKDILDRRCNIDGVYERIHFVLFEVKMLKFEENMKGVL